MELAAFISHERIDAPLLSGLPAVDIALILAAISSSLRYLADRTATILDDQFVDFIDAVRESPALLDFIRDLMKRDLPEGTLPQIGVDAEVKEAFEAAGFDWNMVIDVLLPVLLELIRNRWGIGK